MKKNFLRKITCILTLTLCILAVPQITSAKTLSDKNNYNAQQLKEKVNSLSDSEFDTFLLDYINTNKKNGKDFKASQNELSLAGVTVTKANSISNSSEVTVNYISPSKVNLSSYSAKRSGDSFYRLYGQVTINSSEVSPASLDLLSIEWDYSRASYYSYSTGGDATYMDGTNRSKGICLFNIDDSWMYAGDYAYGVVYVTPTASGTWTDFGSKYVHTYGSSNVSWSVGGNVGYTTTGPTGGVSFTISGTNATDSWQLYADNAFSS